MIKDCYKQGSPIFSIEVFPPKKTADIQSIYDALDQFKELNPSFISVTYGAGGSTSRSTAEIAAYIKNQCGIKALSHLTCASLADEEALAEYMTTLKKNNVENILALRGDKPRDVSKEVFDNRYYKHASDLAAAIKSRSTFCLAGACYPEKHDEADTLEEDIANLRIKVENGVDFLITQLFYDNEKFYRFVDMARKAGISVPISAGLMPITSMSQIKNIIAVSGASLPQELTNQISKYSDSPEDLKKAGLDYTKKQMEALLAHGVDGIHLYSMNKIEIARHIFG